MSSVFGASMSAKIAMYAYRLMLQRVAVVANSFKEFSKLPSKVQECLLQHNADMVVSLRGAHFFQMKKQGQDQILGSLGIDDVQTANNIIAEVQKTHNTNEKDYKAIDYKQFNTIQKKMDNSPEEERYDLLLSRVGTNVCFDENIITLFSYVILFSTYFIDDAINSTSQKSIEEVQGHLITLLQKYIYFTYPKSAAATIFKGVLECIQDLRELCCIKQQRTHTSIPIRKVQFTNSFNVLKTPTNGMQ